MAAQTMPSDPTYAITCKVPEASSKRKHPLLSVILIVLLLLANFLPALCGTRTSFAASPQKLLTQYSLDVWQSDRGLPQNSVNAIVQTRDGYLWFGTQEGLVKFDGVRFTVFDKRTTPEMKSNYIWTLCEDNRNGLWVGTNGGGVLRYADGRWSSFTTASGLASNFVQAIIQDREGTMWFGTAGGLCQLSGNTFVTYRKEQDSTRNAITGIFEDSHGNFWLVVRDQLCLFKGGEILPSPPTSDVADSSISAIQESEDGTLWVGSLDMGGLWRFKQGSWKHFGKREGMPKTAVLSILPDKGGYIWVGTAGEGLFRFVDGKFEQLSVRQGLSDGFVRSLFEDAEKSIWIGTYRGGVNRLRDGTFTPFTRAEGLSNDFVLSVCGDKQNAMWVGTYGGGLNRISRNKITAFSNKIGASGNIITSLSTDKLGNVWVGSFGSGLSVLRNGRFSKIPMPVEGRSAFIIALLCDRKGNVWIGTDGAGAKKYSENSFTSFSTGNGLPDDLVRAFCEGADGSVWIGTAGGLSRVRDGVITTYHPSDGLSSDFILSLYEDDEQTLWIGTDGGGLNRFKDGKFSSFTTKDGLYDDVAFSILDDDSGNLWLSSNKGVYRVEKRLLNQCADGSIRSVACDAYGKAEGMQSSECNGRRQPSAWKGKDGLMWFATIKGVAVVDPHNLKVNTIPAPVAIEEIRRDDELVQPAADLAIGPGVDRLEIHYTGLSFIDPSKVYFKYKLEGYDKDWINALSRRTAYYTSLSPGRYTFRVMAANNDGVWNPTGASIAFSIEPFFTQTVWFYLLCVLGIGAMIVGGYRYRVAQIERNARELSHLVEERTQSLQEESKRAEQALSELALSELRYKHLVENANDSIYRLDTKGRFTFTNQKMIEVSGYSERELQGMYFTDFVHPSHYKRVSLFYDRQISKKIPSTYLEFPAVDRSEKVYWTGQYVQLIFEGDEVVGVQGVARDITKRKMAEDALRESRRFIQRVADATPTILFIFDIIKNDIIYVNNELVTILGYSPDEVRAMGDDVLRRLFHPENYANLARIMDPVKNARDGEIVESELRLLRANGDWCWVYCRVTVFTRTSGGGVEQILGSALDITQRKFQEEALRESEEKYRRLFEESKDVVFMSTIEGRFLSMNPAGLELFGFISPATMTSVDIGTGFFVRREQWDQYRKEIQRSGFVKDYEILVKRADERHLTVVETSTAVRDATGKIVAVRGIMHDVTESRQLLRQLVQAQKMESVGTLAGGVAHDFNNILALILTSAELLKAQVKDNAALSRVANIISSSANRGANIAKQLLMFARSEKGDQKAISLPEVVGEIRQLLEHSMPESIRITTEVEQGAGVVLADSGHIHQVVMNLALNARDAMPDGGSLTFRVASAAPEIVRQRFGSEVAPIPYIVLSVSDTGEGMDEATKHRLFDPFFTTKERGKGTGLGLAIVHGIVKSYHGFIDVVSGRGTGTTFFIYFPSLTQPEQVSAGDIKEDRS